MTTIDHLSLAVPHVPAAVAAPSRDAIASARAVGLDAGAVDEGMPGLRAVDPMPDVFASDLCDPAGNRIGLVHGCYAS